MKIILSRKGFDTGAGKMPSPIMPDGTLLSMPIPSDDMLTFDELWWQGKSYAEILCQLKQNFCLSTCHLDPDIRPNVRNNQEVGWKPAFGQIGSAQGVLRNGGIGVNDLFLFFGLFRQTELTVDGCLQFQSRAPAKQIIFGYFQVEKVLTNPDEIKEYSWHPHANQSRLMDATNTLYIPRKKLNFYPTLPGCGVLDYRVDRVLTMEGHTPATWIERPFYSPDAIIGKRKNSAAGEGLFYGGQWQELILQESDEASEWAKSIIN